MNTGLHQVEGPDGRLDAILKELEAEARGLTVERVPDLLGELERLKAIGQQRLLSAAPQGPQDGLLALLTTKRVAELLGVSERQVERLKGAELRSAVVDVSDGTVRFRADRIRRHIELNTRG